MPSTISHDSTTSWPSSNPELPPSLDPETHRIIAQHFYGVDPHDQAEPDRTILNLAFQHDVERLHRLGPRPQYELLREIERRYGCARFIRERVKRYAELDPEIVAALGGDVFPSTPIREVG